jgi:hypothetical protein
LFLCRKRYIPRIFHHWNTRSFKKPVHAAVVAGILTVL